MNKNNTLLSIIQSHYYGKKLLAMWYIHLFFHKMAIFPDFPESFYIFNSFSPPPKY